MTVPDYFPLERQACSATKVIEFSARIAPINVDPELRCFLVDGIQFASNLAQVVRWALCAVRKPVVTLHELKGIGIDFSEGLLEASRYQPVAAHSSFEVLRWIPHLWIENQTRPLRQMRKTAFFGADDQPGRRQQCVLILDLNAMPSRAADC